MPCNLLYAKPASPTILQSLLSPSCSSLPWSQCSYSPLLCVFSLTWTGQIKNSRQTWSPSARQIRHWKMLINHNSSVVYDCVNFDDIFNRKNPRQFEGHFKFSYTEMFQVIKYSEILILYLRSGEGTPQVLLFPLFWHMCFWTLWCN